MPEDVWVVEACQDGRWYDAGEYFDYQAARRAVSMELRWGARAARCVKVSKDQGVEDEATVRPG